jgi:nucleotidyltransferase/DNA polymerase involved in DNA repair
MFFIGKSTAQLLRKHHINTIGDIANKTNNNLIAHLLDKN